MKRILLIVVAVTGLFSLNSQILPFKLEELTAPDFIKAVEKSSATCILPIGVFEKHGPHMPLGTDLYIAREIALRAAEKEYTVVFPWYFLVRLMKPVNNLVQLLIRMNLYGERFRRPWMSLAEMDSRK